MGKRAGKTLGKDVTANLKAIRDQTSQLRKLVRRKRKRRRVKPHPNPSAS